jgi:hypothetical protein
MRVSAAAILVAISLSSPAFAGDYRIDGPAPIVMPPGQAPPTVYGQEQNRIIEVKPVPAVPKYEAPKYKPVEVPKYEPPKLEDYR